jgi:signal transduction histidine kinase
MSAPWPLDVRDDDDIPLPAPWDGDIDLSDRTTETAYLALKRSQPALALNVCRNAYRVAQVKADERAAVHALYCAAGHLYETSQRALADRVFGLARARAVGMSACSLSVRIELLHAKQFGDRGEHAQAMALWQRALETAMTLGDYRCVFNALGCLANAALVVDDGELALSLCEQQEWYLPREDPQWVNLYSNRANARALALLQISRVRRAAGDLDAARRTLRRARTWAVLACARATRDGSKLHQLESLVQILLESGDAARARFEIERWTARLAALPDTGSELWFLLQVARARVDVHDGHISPQTLEALAQIDALPHDVASDLQPNVGDMRRVLLQAYERLGRHEQALACHKRATHWLARHRTAQARQRIKALRHTLLTMRAEAMEFITHDLLAPLAAAQTWAQALLQQQLPPASAASLFGAQRLLAGTTVVAKQHLCLLRTELTPRTQLREIDIGALADDVCESMVPAPSSRIRLRRTIDIGTPVLGDAVLLTKALAALLTDAFDRAPPDSQVELSLAHDSAKSQAMLSIYEPSAGPTPSTRTQIYRRSLDRDVFTNDNLGLAVAVRVCRLHRVRLRVETVPGGASVLRLTMKTEAHALSTEARGSMAERGELLAKA